MADEIFVINVGGYIGESTKSEIEYAVSKGLSIRYYDDTTINICRCDICLSKNLAHIVHMHCEWYRDNVTFGNKSADECPYFKPIENQL